MLLAVAFEGEEEEKERGRGGKRGGRSGRKMGMRRGGGRRFLEKTLKRYTEEEAVERREGEDGECFKISAATAATDQEEMGTVFERQRRVSGRRAYGCAHALDHLSLLPRHIHRSSRAIQDVGV
jgi:hypothetical protein